MPVYNFTHGVLTITTGSANSVVIGPGAGNFSIQALEQGDQEQEAVYDRADFLERVPKRKKLYQWSMAIMHDGALTDASDEKVMDIVRKTGVFAADDTVDPGEVVWAVNLSLVMTRAGVATTIAMTNSRPIVDFGEGETANQLSLSGDVAGGVGIT